VDDGLIIRAEIGELARVSEWTKAFGQRFALRESTLFAIQLCVEEALSNIVRYAFAPGKTLPRPPREVRLSVQEIGDAIDLMIEDEGMAFDPLKAEPPARPTTIEDAATGGWGIHLMRHFARTLAYERRNGVNRLTLRFDR